MKVFHELAAAALFAFASTAHAQVYKCTDANGKTSDADAPCAPGERQPRAATCARRRAIPAPRCLGESLTTAAEARTLGLRSTCERR
jgi:hypothetical protein